MTTELISSIFLFIYWPSLFITDSGKLILVFTGIEVSDEAFGSCWNFSYDACSSNKPEPYVDAFCSHSSNKPKSYVDAFS